MLLEGPDDRRLDFLEGLASSDIASFCHYSSFLVAEVESTPAAALCGYDADKDGTAALTLAVASVAAKIGWRDAERDAAAARVAPFFTCAPEEPPHTWIIENVATSPEHRGRGLARSLLQAILGLGRERGYRKAQIAVFIGNDPALRAYLQAGFAFADEKRHPEFQAALGCPGITRLLRDL